MSVSFAGITPNNYPVNTRILIDANYVANVTLPNAANVTNTNALNLLNATPYPTTETIDVMVIVGASNGANSKNINVGVQHSTANTDGTVNTSNWVNIATLQVPMLINADNAGNGHAASNIRFKLPPGCNQFIRAQFTGEANGGDASNGTGTLQLLF